MPALEFQTLAEYRAALDRLLAGAQTRLRIYDTTLEKAALNAATRHALLRAFCLSHAQRRIEILLDDPRYVQAQCPRVMQLLRDFSHVLEIRYCDDEQPRPEYGFALADRNMWLKCADKHAPVGLWANDDASAALMLDREFEALWQHAPGRLSATTLGLG